MSWAEVKKINSNMAMPLNEQLRELSYAGAYLITASGAFSPDRTGWYKVIVVSRGGDAYYSQNSGNHGGSSGAVAIKTMRLKADAEYPIVVDNSNSSEDFTSFNDEIICYNTTNAAASSSLNPYGKVGTAEGGDFNYNGILATSNQGQDVGVFIPQLSRTNRQIYFDFGEEELYEIYSGEGILGFGCGTTKCNGHTSGTTKNKGGCVLIIPLELEG